jgi:hypothetical protein
MEEKSFSSFRFCRCFHFGEVFDFFLFSVLSFPSDPCQLVTTWETTEFCVLWFSSAAIGGNLFQFIWDVLEHSFVGIVSGIESSAKWC